MAQIFGCYLTNPALNLLSILSGMGASMRRPTQSEAQVCASAGARGGLGALLSNETGSLTDGSEISSGCALAIDGRIKVQPANGASPVQRIFRQYQAVGRNFVDQLAGSFALGLVDSPRKRLICATDHFATRSLYWIHLPGIFAFSTEVKAFLALPGLDVQVDPQAVAAYLRYGRLFGERTLWANVRRLRPGSMIEYDADRDSVKATTYWHVEEVVGQRHALDATRKEALRSSFRSAVLQYCPDRGRMGLSLSGGLDSRAILAVLAAAKYPVRLRTEGVAGCVDQRVTARLAEQTGYPWKFSALQSFDIAQYVDAMRRYVYLTEGMMVPDGYPGISAMRFAQEEDLAVLQRGHGGENARLRDAWPFQVRDAVLRQQTRAELVSFVEPDGDRSEATWLGLFADSGIRKAITDPADTYASFIGQYNARLTPAEVLSLMYLHINEAGSVAAYRNSLRGYVDMAVPFADDEFLELVLGTRVAERRDSTIHHDLIGHFFPTLLKTTNSNTGAPLDASRLRLYVADKFQAVMRRLNLPGFRHYHNVEKWIANSLRESVRTLLLEQRTLKRGIYEPDALKQVIDQSERPGNSRLLARLVMIEMWFRLFVDREVESYELQIDSLERTGRETNPVVAWA